MSASYFNTFFILIFGFGCVQIDLQLTINLFYFQFHPWFQSIGSLEFDVFFIIVFEWKFLQFNL